MAKNPGLTGDSIKASTGVEGRLEGVWIGVNQPSSAGKTEADAGDAQAGVLAQEFFAQKVAGGLALDVIGKSKDDLCKRLTLEAVTQG